MYFLYFEDVFVEISSSASCFQNLWNLSSIMAKKVKHGRLATKEEKLQCPDLV